MKINNRERNLLLILFIVIIGYIYMNYFYMPAREEMNLLQIEKVEKENELSQLRNEVSEKDNYQELFHEYNDKILELTGDYYSKLFQEDFIILLKDLTPQNLSISEFSFRKISFNDFREQLEINLKFQGEYLDLYEFIDRVNNNPKNILVNKLSIKSGQDKNISGEMTILVDRIIELSGILDEKSYFTENGDLVEKQFDDPFTPYASLAEKYSVSDDEMSKMEIYMSRRTTNVINNFNASETFTIGNDLDVVSTVNLSNKRLYGQHSYEFNYDFGIKKKFNQANLVFEDELVINNQHDFISMWVNAEEITGHEMGVVLIDSNGDDHELIFNSSLDFKGWEVLEVELPIEINYPCKVQRIFVRSTDYDQRLSGSVLIDQLQTADVKELD